jgi:hypothetical protein
VRFVGAVIEIKNTKFGGKFPGIHITQLWAGLQPIVSNIPRNA